MFNRTLLKFHREITGATSRAGQLRTKGHQVDIRQHHRRSHQSFASLPPSGHQQPPHGLQGPSRPHSISPRSAARVGFGTYFLFYFTFTFTNSGGRPEKGKETAAWRKAGPAGPVQAGHLGLFTGKPSRLSKGLAVRQHLNCWPWLAPRHPEDASLGLPLPRILLLVNLIMELTVQDDGIIRHGSRGAHLAEMKGN